MTCRRWNVTLHSVTSFAQWLPTLQVWIFSPKPIPSERRPFGYRPTLCHSTFWWWSEISPWNRKYFLFEWTVGNGAASRRVEFNRIGFHLNHRKNLCGKPSMLSMCTVLSKTIRHCNARCSVTDVSFHTKYHMTKNIFFHKSNRETKEH